jgi:hypothetical protein
MKVEWKDISDYEGYYQISNTGLVRSLDREVKTKGGSIKICKSKIINTGMSQGYKQALLTKNNKRKMFRINRLVALHFCNNPDNKPWVNHLDGIKHNNCFNNLEWCTPSENMQHAYDTGLMKPARNRLGFSGKKHVQSMPVLQFSLDGILVDEFDSINLVKTKGFTPQHVHKCCYGKLKTHKKFKWRLK